MEPRITVHHGPADAAVAGRLRDALAQLIRDPGGRTRRVLVTGPDTSLPADGEELVLALVRGAGLPPGRLAVELREPYWEHDVALLARQAAPEAAALAAYPIAPTTKAAPLSAPELAAVLETTPGWVRMTSPRPDDPASEHAELYRELRFCSFRQAVAFMAMVAPGCDILSHHPRWENTYRTVRIWLSTWDLGWRVSDRDMALARYLDRAFAEYGGTARPRAAA